MTYCNVLYIPRLLVVFIFHYFCIFVRSNLQKYSIQIGVLKNFTKFTENTCTRISIFIFIKNQTLAQVFSREFSEIFQNTFFSELLRWLLLTFSTFQGQIRIRFLINAASQMPRLFTYECEKCGTYQMPGLILGPAIIRGNTVVFNNSVPPT